MAHFAISAASPRANTDDRAAVIEVDGGWVACLADGAGGSSGAARAAERFVAGIEDRVRGRFELSSAPAWTAALQAIDDEIAADAGAGETTGVVVAVVSGRVFGASCGNSKAVLASPTAVHELTEHQPQRPRLGSGRAEPRGFTATAHGTLVIASDGLFDYVPLDEVTRVACSGSSNPGELMIQLVRDNHRRLPDDVVVIVGWLDGAPWEQRGAAATAALPGPGPRDYRGGRGGSEMASNFERAGASELVQAVARGDVSALELCDAAIARIEADKGAINAVVVKDFDRAREAARAADAAIARGERRPLLGLPMTVKESFDVAGLPTTWGLADFADYRPEVDAIAVARLKAAGAVILGKTNVPPSLGDWQTANSIYGRTNHPLDPARTPGGSSGGSAAALASFMVPLELGSDIGGSIRVPAHFCGLFGHKPSLGMLPNRGHKPPRVDGAPSTLSVIGPLARCAADLVLAFDVLVGADPADAVGLRLDAPAPRATSLREARVLVLDAHPSAATDSETRGAIEALAGALARGGARVARHTDLLPDLAHAHDVYAKLLRTEVDRRRPNAGPPISAWDWLALLDERHRVRARWAALFHDFDAVITPVFGTPAFVQFRDEPFQQRTLTIDGAATRYGDQLAWSGVATLPGLPATAVPAGTSREGLPIGVQVIGPWLEDRTPLALAAAIEQLRR